jgi:hypothetical protein
MEQHATTNTVEVTSESGEKKRISARQHLAAIQNLAKARMVSNAGLSERKRQAILRNLAKARNAPRTRASYARSRHNATKHGLYVHRMTGSFLRLGENPRRFARLHKLFVRAFVPRDAIETRLVKRLAEVVWRHLRTYHAAAVHAEQMVRRKLQPSLPADPATASVPGAPASGEEVDADAVRASEIMYILLSDHRLYDRQKHTLNEVERTLRLLLVYRSGNPEFKFHFTGRRYRSEIGDLSDDPLDWPRRYAAGVPLT